MAGTRKWRFGRYVSFSNGWFSGFIRFYCRFLWNKKKSRNGAFCCDSHPIVERRFIQKLTPNQHKCVLAKLELGWLAICFSKESGILLIGSVYLHVCNFEATSIDSKWFASFKRGTNFQMWGKGWASMLALCTLCDRVQLHMFVPLSLLTT